MADFEELNRCRLCFSPNNLTDAIFPATSDPDEELMGMIYACTSIRISFERDFPCAVCSSCVRIVKQFYAFRRRCRNNDRELQRARGETDFEEGSENEEDPLGGSGRVKREAGGDEQVYDQMKQQIQSFLKKEVAALERKALSKVREGLQSRSTGESLAAEPSGLQMTVEEVLDENGIKNHDTAGFDTFQDFEGYDEHEEDGENKMLTDETNWKSKYLTLQKNNDLLQKAFRDQKDKLKTTEQLLKAAKRQKSGNSDAYPVNLPEGIGFKPHPAIPEITVDFLQDLSYKSGPGDKGDRNFISKLAVAVFGVDTLVNSSVTGRSSNAHQNMAPKPPLCSQKIAAIGLKLFERVQQEVGIGGNQEELLARTSEKIVRLCVCQKSMNLRKQVLKHNGVSASTTMEEEYLLETPEKKRRT